MKKSRSRRVSVPSDTLFDVLVAIVNTAQVCPDRCMADVCNDNFTAHNIPLTAIMTDDEDHPIRIHDTSNVAGNRLARQGQSELTGLLGGHTRSEKE